MKEHKIYKPLVKPIVSGYVYRDYELVDDLFFETLDIINCAFVVADEFANLTSDAYFDNVKKFILPRAKKHACYVILSIAPSSKWEAIACSNELISKFAENIVSTINAIGFDGVDLDWEYPKAGQYEWFTLLAKTVNERVKQNNPRHLVTAAIAGGKWQVRYYDLLNSGQYLDYINVMTYSMSSNNGMYQNALYAQQTYHDANNLVGKTMETCSIAESITIFNTNYDIPYNKLIIGVPFYGSRQTRDYDLLNKTWSNWKSPGSLFYTIIKKKYLTNPEYLYHFDTVAQVPYLTKKDGAEFISFEDPESLTSKCQYIYNSEIAGVMFWEYGCDQTGDLLKTIAENLKDRNLVK